MFKFSKKIVSLASSLLALTSLAGSAKAMDDHVNPYAGFLARAGEWPAFEADGEWPAFNDSEGNTFKNAKDATQEEYDNYVAGLSPIAKKRLKNKLKNKAFYVVNRISNHPKTVIGTTVGTATLIGAYKLGVFDGLLGSKGNKKHVKSYFNNNNFDDEDDDIEEYDDNYQDPYNQNY